MSATTGATTAPPQVVVATPTSLISPANIVGSPSSTFAGLGMIGLALGQMVQQNGLPTNTTGWVGFGLTAFSSIMALLARSGAR